MVIKSYKDLLVWQKSFHLCKSVYFLTQQLPDSERYGLVSQSRRAVVSIPSNIAEGKQRGTRRDYVQFLRIALGSAAELDTQLLLMAELFPNVITRAALAELEEIRKMLSTMIRKLEE